MLLCRGSGNSSRFAFVVDSDSIEQDNITAIYIRGRENYIIFCWHSFMAISGWLFTESVARVLSEALSTNCCKTLSSIQ